MQGQHISTGHLRMVLNAFELHANCWLLLRCSSSSALSPIHAGPTHNHRSFAYAFECLLVACHLLAPRGDLLVLGGPDTSWCNSSFFPSKSCCTSASACIVTMTVGLRPNTQPQVILILFGSLQATCHLLAHPQTDHLPHLTCDGFLTGCNML